VEILSIHRLFCARDCTQREKKERRNEDENHDMLILADYVPIKYK
jgi:hypothetical protein